MQKSIPVNVDLGWPIAWQSTTDYTYSKRKKYTYILYTYNCWADAKMALFWYLSGLWTHSAYVPGVSTSTYAEHGVNSAKSKREIQIL